MNNYVYTSRDRRAVHINSRIPNKAFYEICVQSQKEYSWKGVFQIFDKAICEELHEHSNFQIRQIKPL
jgi:Zn-dependent metalloprotease